MDLCEDGKGKGGGAKINNGFKKNRGIRKHAGEDQTSLGKEEKRGSGVLL